MKEKILIVEDNPLNMRLLQLVLGKKGYALSAAGSGGEALDVALREKPALIMMDIQLPGMNGLEVTRKLREIPEFAGTPIIAVTAYAMKGDKEKILSSGCDMYLSKPINTRELPGIVAGLLEKRRQEYPGGK